MAFDWQMGSPYILIRIFHVYYSSVLYNLWIHFHFAIDLRSNVLDFGVGGRGEHNDGLFVYSMSALVHLTQCFIEPKKIYILGI